jgi:hypothetical protein
MSEEGEDNHERHRRVELRTNHTWEAEERARRPYEIFRGKILKK